MKILPIAFDSFGVRSMATYLETEDIRVFIDPGVSISPDRYSLPPHRIEIDRHHEKWEAIKKWAKGCEIIIVTHYHYDHHNPDYPELYKDKKVFLKHPREFINQSQKERAELFLSKIEPLAKNITFCDGKNFTFGRTKIEFSKPVFHGISAQLGYVVEVFIEEQERFIFTSDVEGPLNEDAVNFILEKSPQTLIVDGPATYLLGSHYKNSDIEKAINNLQRITEKTELRHLIIDHHLLRDINWNEYIQNLNTKKNSRTTIYTAAHYSGKKEELLEAERKDMFQAAGFKK